VRLYPSFLAYFNEAVGGRRAGPPTSSIPTSTGGRICGAYAPLWTSTRSSGLPWTILAAGSPVYELGERYLP
jgi:hypothetical protein